MLTMPRPPRLDEPGRFHHVMNRTAARRELFHSDEERQMFLDLIGDMPDRFGLDVHAYCLMGTHYHLLLESKRGELSPAMQRLSSHFTRHLNDRRGTDGPVFRGRFRSVAVEEQSHLVELIRYIHRNPLELGWSRSLERYPWSSHGAHAGVCRGPAWLRRDLVSSIFGSDTVRYCEFVDRVAA
jgi:putative transposase